MEIHISYVNGYKPNSLLIAIKKVCHFAFKLNYTVRLEEQLFSINQNGPIRCNCYRTSYQVQSGFQGDQGRDQNGFLLETIAIYRQTIDILRCRNTENAELISLIVEAWSSRRWRSVFPIL